MRFLLTPPSQRLRHLSAAEHHFAQAVSLYTLAISKDGTNAVYFGNRSFAHIKVSQRRFVGAQSRGTITADSWSLSQLENYGSAVEDAEKAVQLDKTYIKGYYRRETQHRHALTQCSTCPDLDARRSSPLFCART